MVKKVFLQCRRPQFNSWVRKIPWRRDRLPIPVFLGCPCGSAGKESTYNVGDLGSIPNLERSPGEGKGYPLQYSGQKNSMDCTVHGIAKSQTQLRDFHFQHFHGARQGVPSAKCIWYPVNITFCGLHLYMDLERASYKHLETHRVPLFPD